MTNPAATTTDPSLDYESKDTYTLVISAEDAENPGKKSSATVMVSLIDMNETPYFDKETQDKVDSLADYAENRTTPVVALAAMEPDGAALDWELTGKNAGDFMIEDIPDGTGSRDRVNLVFKDGSNPETTSRRRRATA